MLALVADDDRVATTALRRTLERWGVEVVVANDGHAAWTILTSETPPAIAIIDWMMPGLDGLELCRRARQHPGLTGLYVILLTGRDSRTDIVAGLDSGADDYMVKPFDLEQLRARVQVGMRSATLQQRLAERLADLQAARDHLARLVHTDTLTELCSRRWWFELASAEFSRFRRYNRPLALLCIDIDLFKHVNDTFGHGVGDDVLRRFADMLRAQSRQSDVIGRLGGEEFALLATDTSLGAAERVASRIVESCRALAVSTDAGPVTWTCSVGTTAVCPSDSSIERALQRADDALYLAKRSGRDCWRTSESTTEIAGAAAAQENGE